MVYALAIIRIDLPAMLRQAMRPGRILRTLGLSLALIVATPVTLHAIAALFGLPPDLRAALVYAHAAPPIASAAGLCLLLGLDAAIALEISIVASFLTPLTGPIVILFLLGETVPMDGWTLAGKLGLIIALGTLTALLARRALGPARIERHGTAFDGVTAIGMLFFLLPVFDGFVAAVMAGPMLALAILLLAFATNFGLQFLTFRASRLAVSHEAAGATGILWGNRNVTLFLASVPESPVFSLYVALYQFPMYFTPLIMRPVYAVLRNRR
jgi:predicted Na+-dependent transporter